MQGGRAAKTITLSYKTTSPVKAYEGSLLRSCASELIGLLINVLYIDVIVDTV